ncbi:MAG: Transglycosylase-like domain [Gaiellales bacterium]|nr:Transglycosylase-like domain [Gaiellales bacterium]
MRSLATQLVALVLAVPVAAVASSHSSSSHWSTNSSHLMFKTPVIEHSAKHHCRAYCQARKLRHTLRRVHGRTVALARRAALPDPPSPRLGWHRSSLRVELKKQAHVLYRYRARAARPLRRRLARFEAWVCIHRHEAAWNDTGDPYWGGLQMDRGFMRAYGDDMIARHHGGLADTWTPAEQIVVAERAYKRRGFAPWPNTSRSCGVR